MCACFGGADRRVRWRGSQTFVARLESFGELEQKNAGVKKRRELELSFTCLVETKGEKERERERKACDFPENLPPCPAIIRSRGYPSDRCWGGMAAAWCRLRLGGLGALQFQCTRVCHLRWFVVVSGRSQQMVCGRVGQESTNGLWSCLAGVTKTTKKTTLKFAQFHYLSLSLL